MKVELNHREVVALQETLRERVTRLKEIRSGYTGRDRESEQLYLDFLNRKIVDILELIDKLEEAELSL